MSEHAIYLSTVYGRRNTVIIPHFYVVSELNVAMMEHTQKLRSRAALAHGKWLLQLPHLLRSRRLMPGTFPVKISRAAPPWPTV